MTANKDTKPYFTPNENGRWTFSVTIGGHIVALIQNTPLFDEKDAGRILQALGISTIEAEFDHYFPRNTQGKRCPTLELLERAIVLDPTNPKTKQKGREAGV